MSDGRPCVRYHRVDLSGDQVADALLEYMIARRLVPVGGTWNLDLEARANGSDVGAVARFTSVEVPA